jgi:pimeloyl-ACP methyl ester carboxylesterase
MSPHPFSEHALPGDGVLLNGVRAGTGSHTVILLHGFPENSSTWLHQIHALADAGFNVIAPDLRGYGASERPPSRQAYGIRHLVDDVAAIIRSEGDRASVVGHDWGGVIAWAFAEEYPNLLDRLVILNAPHPRIFAKRVRRPPQMLRSWYVLFFLIPWLPERILSAADFSLVRSMFSRLPARPDTFSEERIEQLVDGLRPKGALTAALNYYRANALRMGLNRGKRKIEAPTLVLWGDLDPALGVELLDGLDRYVENVRIQRFSEASHWIQNEVPEEVSRALVEFLRGSSDSPLLAPR